MSGYTVKVSSAGDGKGRWTEIELSRFEDGSYDLNITGASDEPGEWDLIKSRGCDDAAEVIHALRAPGGGLSRLAVQLITDAAVQDETMRLAWSEQLIGGTDADRARGSRRGWQDDPR